jgi:hypothetical protein
MLFFLVIILKYIISRLYSNTGGYDDEVYDDGVLIHGDDNCVVYA